jgi:hypothetical protein
MAYPLRLVRRISFGLLLGTLVAVAAAGPANADGSPTIAGAPIVSFGQQQFGNVASDPYDPSNCNVRSRQSWWLLSVVAGDDLVIDWEAQSSSIAMSLFGVGVTDYTSEQTDPVAFEYPNANLHAEMSYSATASGSMPLEFATDNTCSDALRAGPYDFTATVTHAVRLALPVRSQLRSGRVVKVAVHNPEGGAVNDPKLIVGLQIKLGKRWRTIGAAPVVDSTATVKAVFASKLRGRRVRVRARAHGPSYRTANSRTRRMRLR